MFKILPEQNLNIYPKNKENIQAILDHYFKDYNVKYEDALEILINDKLLSLNQIEFIIRNLSEAYIPIFKLNLQEPIGLGNLTNYGLSALVSEKYVPRGSKNRLRITEDFKNFVISKYKNIENKSRNIL